MQAVDSSVFQHLREGIKGGFDEERYAARVGFGNLKRWEHDLPSNERLLNTASGFCLIMQHTLHQLTCTSAGLGHHADNVFLSDAGS